MGACAGVHYRSPNVLEPVQGRVAIGDRRIFAEFSLGNILGLCRHFGQHIESLVSHTLLLSKTPHDEIHLQSALHAFEIMHIHVLITPTATGGVRRNVTGAAETGHL